MLRDVYPLDFVSFTKEPQHFFVYQKNNEKYLGFNASGLKIKLRTHRGQLLDLLEYCSK